MTDDEWDQQARTTAGAIKSHNQATEDARRAAVNAYSEASDLIDDQEDLINEYRGSGLSQMRAVHSYVDGNNKDWEEVQKAIDAIAEKEKGIITNRRGLLAALGVTGASAAGGGVLAASQLFGPSATSFAVADTSEFVDFYQGLRENQKSDIGLIYGDENEFLSDGGRDLVAFEARDNGGDSTEPEYKAWVKFPGGEIDDYDWQNWNNDDYRQFAERVGTVGEEERIGDEGYINSILEGDLNE